MHYIKKQNLPLFKLKRPYSPAAKDPYSPLADLRKLLISICLFTLTLSWKNLFFTFIHSPVTMSLRETTDSLVFMKFTSVAVQEVRQEVADQAEWALKWDITRNLSISRKLTEGAGMIPKDNSILLMHDKALEL